MAELERLVKPLSTRAGLMVGAVFRERPLQLRVGLASQNQLDLCGGHLVAQQLQDHRVVAQLMPSIIRSALPHQLPSIAVELELLSTLLAIQETLDHPAGIKFEAIIIKLIKAHPLVPLVIQLRVHVVLRVSQARRDRPVVIHAKMSRDRQVSAHPLVLLKVNLVLGNKVLPAQQLGALLLGPRRQESSPKHLLVLPARAFAVNRALGLLIETLQVPIGRPTQPTH